MIQNAKDAGEAKGEQCFADRRKLRRSSQRALADLPRTGVSVSVGVDIK